MTDEQKKTPGVEEQAEPIRELIEHARERNVLAKSNSARGHLIEALLTLGRTRKEAERIVDNARVRLRNAANNADEQLRLILHHEKPCRWTHPREAIREMRSRVFGDPYDRRPLTDIEEALIQHGNVLLIIALYRALKWPIFSRLKSASGSEVSREPAPPESGPDFP